MKLDFCLYIHITLGVLHYNIIEFIQVKLFYYDNAGLFLIWSSYTYT